MSGIKLVNSKDRVEDRVEVDDSSRINVPQEYHKVLVSMKSDAEELEKARKEVGRLSQVLHNLVNVCNNIEERMTTNREELTRKLGLTSEGRWVVDFNEKAFFRVVPGGPTVI